MTSDLATLELRLAMARAMDALARKHWWPWHDNAMASAAEQDARDRQRKGLPPLGPSKPIEFDGVEVAGGT